MDILQMIDRLEELLNESRPLPFTHNVIVDEDRMLDLIDQMRVSIPEEVKKAQQLLAQRDRLIAQAQEEAQRTVNLARDRSNELVERDQVVQAAYTQAEQIKAQAHADGEIIRKEADQYVLGNSEEPGIGNGTCPQPGPQWHPYPSRRATKSRIISIVKLKYL